MSVLFEKTVTAKNPKATIRESMIATPPTYGSAQIIAIVVVAITAERKRFIVGNIRAPSTLPAKSWETLISAIYKNSKAADISLLNISINAAKPGMEIRYSTPEKEKRTG